MPDPKPTLLDDLIRLKNFLQNAFKSGTYLYPLKGIFYFLTHKPLWTPLLSRTIPTATIGLGVTSSMFFFTYVPQAAILSFTNGPLAPFSAALLVLSESSAITAFLARFFFLRDALLDTFDGTLLEQGCGRLVATGREVNTSPSTSSTSNSTSTSSAGEELEKLGKITTHPIEESSLRTSVIRSLLYLPLNFIPIIGTPVYVILQGSRAGEVAHARYFQLKGWDAKKRRMWLDGLKAEYLSFGVVAFLLEMIPFVSLGFAFTNTVGAALWAVDLERVIQ